MKTKSRYAKKLQLQKELQKSLGSDNLLSRAGIRIFDQVKRS